MYLILRETNEYNCNSKTLTLPYLMTIPAY